MTTKDKSTKEEPQPETYKVVRFTEAPGLRLISKADWEAAGVPDHADTFWGPANDWTVRKADMGDLNDEQYSRIILADRYFREETVTAPVAE
jgi:hypothetical protein